MVATVSSGRSHGAGNGHGESGDPARVAFGFAILQVERVAQSLQRNVVGAFQVA